MTRGRAATIVYGAFGLLVTVFVIHSIVQVAGVCFGLRPARPVPAACAEGVRGLLTALDRAALAADGARDRDAARAAFAAALPPEWGRKGEVRASCEGEAGSLAYADVLRLARLLEEAAGRQAASAGPLRQRLEASLALQGTAAR